MNKYKQLRANWDEVTGKLMNSKEEMKSFLDFSSKMYKTRFSDAALSYLQNSESTKVADLKKWNKLGRYVKRGEKSICVFDEGNKPHAVFDVSQTFGKSLPKLWSLNEELADRLLVDLNSENHDYSSLEEALSDLVSQTVNDHISIFEAMCERRDLSMEQITRLYDTVVSVTKYIVFRRAELDGTVKFSDELNLDAFDDFTDMRDMRSFGAFVQKAANNTIIPIERKILEYIAEDEKNKEENYNERNRTGIQAQFNRTVRGSDGIYIIPGGAEAAGGADTQMGQNVDEVDESRTRVGRGDDDNGMPLADNSSPDRQRSGGGIRPSGRDLPQAESTTGDGLRGNQTLGEGEAAVHRAQDNGGHSVQGQGV